MWIWTGRMVMWTNQSWFGWLPFQRLGRSYRKWACRDQARSFNRSCLMQMDPSPKRPMPNRLFTASCDPYHNNDFNGLQTTRPAVQVEVCLGCVGGREDPAIQPDVLPDHWTLNGGGPYSETYCCNYFETHHSADNEGWTGCCGGKPIPCTFVTAIQHNKPNSFQIMIPCTKAHERVHANNRDCCHKDEACLSVDCDECLAWRANFQCLLDKCYNGVDPGPNYAGPCFACNLNPLCDMEVRNELAWERQRITHHCPPCVTSLIQNFDWLW
jgi:hypothetical protein